LPGEPDVVIAPGAVDLGNNFIIGGTIICPVAIDDHLLDEIEWIGKNVVFFNA
jgi:hypothetical protein